MASVHKTRNPNIEIRIFSRQGSPCISVLSVSPWLYFFYHGDTECTEDHGGYLLKGGHWRKFGA